LKANSHGLGQAVTTCWHKSQLPKHKDKSLATRTATEWFHCCEYEWRNSEKAVYKDGHEHEDVLQYREDVFLPCWAELEPTFVYWTL
jgi:hypothetical protein